MEPSRSTTFRLLPFCSTRKEASTGAEGATEPAALRRVGETSKRLNTCETVTAPVVLARSNKPALVEMGVANVL